ncbi:MAG: MFS transporter [Nitrospirota bacterium]
METAGNTASRLPFHYGWIIVGSGTLCIIAALGFGRFTLGMLLPSMGATLHLSYAQMGLISTGNFLGYLISVLMSGSLTTRLGARKLIFSGLLLVGFSMLLISYSESFAVVLLLYLLTGFGSGAANVPTMGLVSTWFAKQKRGRAAGFISIGSGFAIIFSGKVIPYINNLKGTVGWRTSWLLLGILVLLIALVILSLIRNRPEEKGLKAAGSEYSVPEHHVSSEDLKPVLYKKKLLYHLGALYFLFGYTYAIYVTFIVTTLVKEHGFSESVAGNFWSWVGFLSLFSGPVFGSLSDKLGRKTGLMIVFSFQMLAYLLAATKLPGIFLYLSIFFFGIVAWSIPSIMAAAVGDYVGPVNAAAAFGFITFIFGFGQISGPAVAGVLAEVTGSFSSSFSMAAFFAAAAVVGAALLKKPSPAARTH